MTITEFLEARIAEDEALAEAASVSMHGDRHKESWDYGSYVLGCERDATEAQDRFITEFWPARVLAECAAKRAIIELADQVETMDYQITNEWGGGLEGTGDNILRALAAVYKDHHDYQETWG